LAPTPRHQHRGTNTVGCAMPPKKKKAKSSSITWEWKDDEGSWNRYDAADAALLEQRFQKDATDIFCTTDFTFNSDHKTVYEVDFNLMTQTNKETAVCRGLRREGKGYEPKAASAISVPPWEWVDDAGEWHEFNDEDAHFLEKEYIDRGPKASFKTRDFSFNKVHKTLYHLNFEAMTQRNTESGNCRKIRRGIAVAKDACTVPWEWWEIESKSWRPYAVEDATLLEAAFQGGGAIFLTKDLSFNAEYNSQYIFDFKVMTQMNSDSGTSRKMRRVPEGTSAGPDGEPEDSGYASALADGFSASSGSASAESGVTSFDFTPSISKTTVSQQKARGAQSRRGGQSPNYGPAVSKDAHGRHCFDVMLKNEAAFAGEWVVFYHSYSAAALLYEVQAAVASVLFRFKSRFATLPRLLYKPFEHIPNAARMLEEFPKWPDRDHNPAFRSVGLFPARRPF